MDVFKALDMIHNYAWDEADIYGSALGAQFSCADALHSAGQEIPHEWQYSPSPVKVGLSAEDDPLAWELWVAATEGRRISWDDVRFAGAAMRGIVDRCKAEGRDY